MPLGLASTEWLGFTRGMGRSVFRLDGAKAMCKRRSDAEADGIFWNCFFYSEVDGAITFILKVTRKQ